MLPIKKLGLHKERGNKTTMIPMPCMIYSLYIALLVDRGFVRSCKKKLFEDNHWVIVVGYPNTAFYQQEDKCFHLTPTDTWWYYVVL